MDLEKRLKQRVGAWLKDTSEWLDISNFHLYSLPYILRGLEHLVVRLACFDNQLIYLPILPNLIKLNCSNNRLTYLPVLPKLTELICWNNQLTSLPLLPKLTKLWCDNNQLTSLPSFPKLTDLGCYKNQLTSLPLLPKLAYLGCWSNQLTSLPIFPKLTSLGCSHNKLFSTELTEWKRVWCLKTLRSNEIRSRGLLVVIKVLKNRLYLPRLESLKQELVYSPNHPGKFYKNLRVGNWSFETTKPTTNQIKTLIKVSK